MTEGSPIWQGSLLLFGILFLAFETWRGWRAGFARSGINFAAIVIGSVVGLFVGRMAAAPFGGFGEPGGLLAGLLFGGGLGLFVYFVLWLTGIIFFKRTDHQATGIFRLFWGAGGAFFGLLMGVLILWGGISAVRAIGALAEANVQSATAGASHAPGLPLAQPLLKLKESLELGPTGNVVKSVDPIPAETYELITQVGRLSTDQRALMRFLAHPSVQEVVQSPELAALIADPKVLQAAEERNFAALLSNPALLKAVSNPVLAEKLKKVDLHAALQYALEKPEPKATPASPSH